MKIFIDFILSVSLFLFNLFFRLTKKEVGHNVYQINKDIKLKLRPGTTDVFIASEIVDLKEYTKHFEIKSGDVVVDIGAHIGAFSVYAAKKAYMGKVYAYEPNPENYSYLVINKELNNLGNLYTKNVAVASSKRPLTLYLAKSNFGGHSILKSDSSNGIKVDAISLKQVFEDNKISKINLLKIDAEGAEYEIIFATNKKFLAKIDKIAKEYHDDMPHGHNHQELVEYLERNGFEVEIVSFPILGNVYKTGLIRAIRKH